MSTGTDENPPRIVLDTNVLISAVGFGGKPREILNLVLDDQIRVVTSPILLAELEDVIHKKFPSLSNDFNKLSIQIKKKFRMVKPKETIEILKDIEDNRVLEAAIEGKCGYIVTGDSDLLILKTFREIKILTPDDFLKELQDI